MPTPAARAAKRRVLIADRGGNIAILTALILPVLLGACGLGSEVAYWFYSVRAMQNAADSAAVAAATNGSSSYATEAQAVTSLYGYQNGAGQVTVSALNTAACPAGGANCYSVTITKLTPLFLSQLVGFKGTTTVNGVHYTQLTATATATIQANADACVLVLDPSDSNAMTTTGGNINLKGCDLQVDSNSSDAMSVTGGTINASGINVVGNYQSTGGNLTPTPATGKPAVSDPYAGLYAQNDVASIGSQSASCTSTKPVTVTGTTETLPPGNYCGGISVTGGSLTLSAGQYNIAGGISVTGGSLTLGAGQYNIAGGLSDTGGSLTLGAGQYNIMGGTLSFTGGTVTGSGVTFVLTNDNGGSYATEQLTGGVVNLSAPTSGEWAGMLFYENPNAPTGVTQSFTGGSNTFTGALYFPTQTLDYTGGSTASSCTQIVAYKLQFTGGSTIGSSCTGTGVQAIPVGGRGELVS
jgi:Flp pilus assembly protein TadG